VKTVSDMTDEVVPVTNVLSGMIVKLLELVTLLPPIPKALAQNGMLTAAHHRCLDIR
jgi:hypothetical protein